MRTRLDKVLPYLVGLLGLLILAASLNPLLRRPKDPPGAALPPVHAVAADTLTLAQVKQDVVKAQEASVQAEAAAAIKPPPPKPSVPPAASHLQAPAPAPAVSSSGVLSCSAVEHYWEAAGGPASVAVTSAMIAGAESDRDPAAPYGGLWQIQGGQPVAGDLNDPMINAENAVSKYRSAGNSFSPWTTWTSGAYLNHPC